MISTTLAIEKPYPTVGRTDICDVIMSILRRCEMQWPVVEYNYEFDALCRSEAIRYGYPIKGKKSLDRFISSGVVMSITAYAHLKSEETRVFVALYTAAFLYIDDIFQHDINIVQDFNERFVLLKRQEDDVLNGYARMLLEAPKLFSKVAANLITTSTLNLVTAMSLEYETQGMAIPPAAHRYPEFSRILSGTAKAYAFFVFPKELELPTFIQAIPEMMVYLNYGNDILSFYKEELAGESVNFISLLASQRCSSKIETLWHIADIMVDTHTRTLDLLKPHPAALEAYTRFAAGYLGFHFNTPRYKLRELDLELA